MTSTEIPIDDTVKLQREEGEVYHNEIVPICRYVGGKFACCCHIMSAVIKLHNEGYFIDEIRSPTVEQERNRYLVDKIMNGSSCKVIRYRNRKPEESNQYSEVAVRQINRLLFEASKTLLGRMNPSMFTPWPPNSNDKCKES